MSMIIMIKIVSGRHKITRDKSLTETNLKDSTTETPAEIKVVTERTRSIHYCVAYEMCLTTT